ncbi:MAG TPA: glycosyltransferase family 2 protein [Rhodopila sp.]|nr:glycosyltransferase family 2 protein [Rhodopila sp.]
MKQVPAAFEPPIPAYAAPAVAPRPTPGRPDRFCVIVPVFNEATGIAEFHRRLSTVMTQLGPWQVIYVNDGSTDDTLAILKQVRTRDDHIALVNLSRNFGKEIAMTAGLDHAAGDAIIVIDADLQDPPEVIPKLVDAWRDGYDVVYAQRSVRHGETWLKRTTANLFYRLMQDVGNVHLPRNTGDFRLMSWRVVQAVRSLREGHRFMKGLFAWVGFPSKAILYERAPRHAGATKWNYWKLWNFAIEGITSFTVMPLKVASYLGLAVSVLAALFILQLIVRTILFGNQVAGYPSLMAVVLFMGGVQLLTLGVIGEYLGRVFNETKHRPLYLVESFLPPEN